jgi:hypothetical protein
MQGPSLERQGPKRAYYIGKSTTSLPHETRTSHRQSSTKFDTGSVQRRPSFVPASSQNSLHRLIIRFLKVKENAHSAIESKANCWKWFSFIISYTPTTPRSLPRQLYRPNSCAMRSQRGREHVRSVRQVRAPRIPGTETSDTLPACQMILLPPSISIDPSRIESAFRTQKVVATDCFFLIEQGECFCFDCPSQRIRTRSSGSWWAEKGHDDRGWVFGMLRKHPVRAGDGAAGALFVPRPRRGGIPGHLVEQGAIYHHLHLISRHLSLRP